MLAAADEMVANEINGLLLLSPGFQMVKYLDGYDRDNIPQEAQVLNATIGGNYSSPFATQGYLPDIISEFIPNDVLSYFDSLRRK